MERYPRNFKSEGQWIDPPHDLTSRVDVHPRSGHFYNLERPHPARSGAHPPPRLKFPQAPHRSSRSHRPSIRIAGGWRAYPRQRDSPGGFQWGNPTYSGQKKRHGQGVRVWVDGSRRELAIFAQPALIQKLSIQGLQNRRMDFPESLERRCQEAVSAWRRTLRPTPTYRQVTM